MIDMSSAMCAAGGMFSRVVYTAIAAELVDALVVAELVALEVRGAVGGRAGRAIADGPTDRAARDRGGMTAWDGPNFAENDSLPIADPGKMGNYESGHS
jgi:hypothetical protein